MPWTLSAVVAAGFVYSIVGLVLADQGIWQQVPVWALSGAVAAYVGVDLVCTLYSLQDQPKSRVTYVVGVGLSFILFGAFIWGDSIAWRAAVGARSYHALTSAFTSTLLVSLVPAAVLDALIVVLLYRHERKERERRHGKCVWLTEAAPVQNILGLTWQLFVMQQLAIIPSVLFVYGLRHLRLAVDATPGDMLTAWFGFAAFVATVFLFSLSILVNYVSEVYGRRDEYYADDPVESRRIASRIARYCTYQAIFLGAILSIEFGWTLLAMTSVLFA